MGRVSNAEAAKTRQKIIEATFAISMAEGPEFVTFKSVAAHAGVSMSGINRHFTKKADLLRALIPLYLEVIQRPLVFDSPELFYESWIRAFDNNSEFTHAVLVLNAGSILDKQHAINNLLIEIKGDALTAKRSVYMAIGYALAHS